MKTIGEVLMNGEPVGERTASISVFDIGFQRGYGCFEAVRAYDGVIFRLDRHLARLQASAALLHLPLPPISEVEAWMTRCAGRGGDCVVRVLVSGGTSVLTPGVDSAVIVYAEPLIDLPDNLRLLPLEAPWHAAGSSSELTGAKTLSYGPNLAATLAAQQAGFDDALLLARDGSVLEGPTYSVAWVKGGVLETPGLTLGVLESVTRGAVLDLAPTIGLEVSEGVFSFDDLLAADEVVALSTLKEVSPVAAVGGREWDPGPYGKALAAAFQALVVVERPG